MNGRHIDRAPARSRTGRVLAMLATACGLWFGITAPDVSPVAPDAVPAVQQDGRDR
jgi:hypothetical protein